MELSEYLVKLGLLSGADGAKAAALSRGQSIGLIEAIDRLNLADPQQLAQSVAQAYGLRQVADGDWPASLEFAGSISKPFLRANTLLPLARADGRMAVAVADPSNASALEALRLASGCVLELRVAAARDIAAALDRLAATTIAARDDAPARTGTESYEDVEQLKDLALGAPVVSLVNEILLEARRMRATDVHIEPTRTRLIVRLRIDGILREVRSPPVELGRAIVSRIKILSGLDIAERRLPQDGRTRLRLDGTDLDLRVATVPTINGESCAIRLLDNTLQRLDLAQLGFTDSQQATLRRYLGAPYGLLLVTGPTGSGKTTTLAAALTILNEPTRKILTVEDPIEYQVDGINQIQVKPEIGITFAHALRSFLRHDPDVIMVGELRDTETARVAIQASLTGHLVLATLHTNSAAGAVARLLDMGIDGYLLASSLRAVIGQRLVRTLCTRCRVEVEAPIDLPADMLALAGVPVGRPVRHWAAKGCNRCFNSGYSGRTSLIEVFEADDNIRRMIKPDVSLPDLTAAAMRAGLRPMAVDGIAKCIAGLTTPEEVRRVVVEG